MFLREMTPAPLLYPFMHHSLVYLVLSFSLAFLWSGALYQVECTTTLDAFPYRNPNHPHSLPLPPHEYDYFAVHVHGTLTPASDLPQDRSMRRLVRRQEVQSLHSKARDLASATGFHYYGRIGELADYFIFAAPRSVSPSSNYFSGEETFPPFSDASSSLDSLSPDSDESKLSPLLPPHTTPATTGPLLSLLSSHPDVKWVGHQVRKRRLFKRNPIPEALSHSADDALQIRATAATKQQTLNLFNHIKSVMSIQDPIFDQQWHLINLKTIGNDMNVSGVWEQGFHGNGSTVCFLDDGLDYKHPDLADNFNAEASYDFNDHQALPTPKLWDDNHGTRCAGEVAAKRNSVCGVGVAWEARVSAVRILSGALSEADEAAAINYKFDLNTIYSCSWGPPDNGKAMDAPPRIAQDAFKNGIEHGRHGLGSIFVFAAGNGGNSGDNCNFDGYTNSIYSITIGAVDELNRHPGFSERCAAMMGVQYSSGSNRAISTTDWKGGCTNAHGGTSAAAPLVSGILAIVLGLRPELTWRDVQYITLYGAVPFELSDAGWQKTAQGRHYHPDFGFGRIDAYRTVQAARNWTLVASQTSVVTSPAQVDQSIPNNSEGLSSELEVTAEQIAEANLTALEHVTVTLTLRHQRRGDCSFRLVSPSGITSYLADSRNADKDRSGFKNWTFTSVVHWGEEPVGKWTLVVIDSINPEATGTLESWFLTLYGATKEVVPPAGFEPDRLADEYTSTPAEHGTNIRIPTIPSPELNSLDVWVVGSISVGACLFLLGIAFFSARRGRRGLPSTMSQEDLIPLVQLEEGRGAGGVGGSKDHTTPEESDVEDENSFM